MKRIIKKFWQWVLRGTLVDDKIIAFAKEVERRNGLLKEELKDVVKATKEVGNQIGDLGDAVKGKPRKGRKKKEQK